MGIVTAIFNQAGGVAKTTLTMNLGYHLALRDRRVLLIDLDPQASLTKALSVDVDALTEDQTIYGPIVDRTALPVMPRPTFGVDLVPSELILSTATPKLAAVMARETRLRQAIAPVRDQYDHLLIDCAPTVELLSLLALMAADRVLIPVETQWKAWNAVPEALRTIEAVREARLMFNITDPLTIAGFVPTRYSKTYEDHRATLAEMRDRQHGAAAIAPVLEPVPNSTLFGKAFAANVPLALYDKTHKAVGVLKRLAAALDAKPRP
ncbi:MAG: ParA family protein [Cyanophyceae cyanobacterium]